MFKVPFEHIVLYIPFKIEIYVYNSYKGFAIQWEIIGVGAGLLLLSIIIFTSILIVLLVKLQRAKHTNMKLIGMI